MAISFKIMVMDAAPLIFLAAGKSLAYLLYPSLPVFIPDAVFHEATAASDKLGAQEIIDWYRANTGAVRIEPTAIFQREAKVVEALGGRFPRDMGERSALELIRAYPFVDEERALLLSDDRDAERLSIVDPSRLVLLGTWDFLRQLEAAQRIQSADAFAQTVAAAGVSLPKRDLFGRHDPAVRDAVREILGRPKS